MSTVVFLLVFLIVIVFGFWAVKRLGAFLEENHTKYDAENRENVIKIVCENPIMLPSVTEVLEKVSKEFKEVSFSYYTGSRADIQKMMENENADIVLLMEETDIPYNKNYGKKVSSFITSSLSEPFSGLIIEPVKNEKMVMYVFWNENYLTEERRELISYI